MNILITGIGGPTPRSFARALKKYGTQFTDAVLIGTDCNPLAYGLYQRELFDHTVVIPPAGDPAYWPNIESLIAKYRIDLAVILPEVEVLAWAERADNQQLPCKVLLPAASLCQLLVDKARMTEALQAGGWAPSSVSFQRDQTDFNAIFEQLGKDFWVRSSSGSSGLGSLRIQSPEDLRQWIRINPAVNHFLASSYLPGRNLACKLLYWQGKLLRSACAERVNYIMAKVAPSGITGNTSFGRLLNEPALVERAIGAMDHLFALTGTSKHGFFTVDFKEDGYGKPFITEINVRHVAFTQCFAAGGANFAEDTIRLLSRDVSLDHSYRMYEFEPGLIFLRDVDEVPVVMKEEELLSMSRPVFKG